MANLQAINERLTATIAEMTKLQRVLENEILAANPPADQRLTRAEWERLQATQADETRAAEVAAQSAAMGNTDAATRAQAADAKAADAKPAEKK